MADPGLLHALFQGLVTGSYIALGAIGLGLVYNIAKVPNFAHGELLMVGAYFGLVVNIPWRLPVFNRLADEGVLGMGLLAGLFVTTAGSTLAIFYLLGGMRALKGSWWPIDVNPNVALATHVIIALATGVYVIGAAPSVVAGLVFATILVAAVSPVFDRLLFRRFRDAGASLATMLIVTMGLAFAIRFSMQAVFEGTHRSYNFPRFIEIFGYNINLFHFKEFDFFFADGGLTFRVVDTATSPNSTIALVEYSWLMLAVLLIGTIGLGAGSYVWRRGGLAGQPKMRTIGPRMTGGVLGVFALFALGVVLAQPAASVPESYLFATQIRNSYFRLGMIVIAVLLMIALHVLLKETKLGKAMRASADNIDLAEVTGIDTRRVMMTTWIIAGAYAAIAGVFVGMLFHNIRPTMGFFLLLPLFAAVILGGLANIYGAIIGAYVVGISMEVGLLTLGLSGVHRPTIAFVILLLVLLVRPEGIVGRN